MLVPVLAIVAFLALLIGVIGLIRPIPALHIKDRRTASYVMGGGLLLCLLAGVVYPAVSELTSKPAPTSEPTASGAAGAMPGEAMDGRLRMPFPCIPVDTAQYFATVVGVVDGDTIDVSRGSDIERVHYVGINAPDPGESLYREATNTNAGLVGGKNVLLVRDVSETDDTGKLLRLVVVLGDPPLFVNYELVHQGLALADSRAPNVRCADLLEYAQEDARRALIGIWSIRAP